MLKWIKGGISAVTGMAEPEYGKDYIHSVADRVKNKQPYRETSREDFFGKLLTIQTLNRLSFISVT